MNCARPWLWYLPKPMCCVWHKTRPSARRQSSIWMQRWRGPRTWWGNCCSLRKWGERALVLAPLDLARDVASDLAALVPSAMQRNIELALDAPDSLVVAMERQTFKSILHNLVGNAIRYVHEGGKVEVSLALQGADIVLAVTDNGPGIPADQHELVFERFHRGGDHAASGVGLGLAIVRQACKRLGGTVALGSGLQGAGCQFGADPQPDLGKKRPLSGRLHDLHETRGPLEPEDRHSFHQFIGL